MQQTIQEILEEKIPYELPSMLFSQEKLSITLEAGTTLQDELYFGASDNTRIRGRITSSNRRLVPGFLTFDGNTVRLPYGVDAEGLVAGEGVDGWLTVISNIGEYRIPFEIRTGRAALTEGRGSILTLEEFCDLARRDFREAFRLFTSPEFAGIIRRQQPRIRALALAFTTQPVTYQHLEEFLIACGLKERVTISVSDPPSEFVHVTSSFSEKLLIQRSGWGHLRLEAEAEGPFLDFPQKVVTDESFIGSRLELAFVLDRDRLGAGRQRGRLCLRTPYQQICLPVAASAQIENNISISLLEKKHRLSLLRDLLDFQCSNIAFDEWKAGTRYSLERLADMGFDVPEYQMLRVWLLYNCHKEEEARRILSPYTEKVFTPEETILAGTVLYLSCVTGMVSDREKAVSRLQRMYMQRSDSWLLLHFILQLDPEMKKDSAAIRRMEELYKTGSSSPFLYLDAYHRLVKNPDNLMRLDGFWIQVFSFAARRGLLTQELCMRFVYLSGYEKEYHPLIALVLEKCCELFPDDDTLQALCRFLIMGNPRQTKYFRWFSMAVSRGLRLTRLYEYYMETLDASVEIQLPRQLLLYFKYNNDTLGDARKAFLYASVVLNKDRDPDTYRLYQNHMKEFAVKKLARGSINENYAVLYREFMTRPVHTHDAAAIAKMLGTCRLYSDDSRVRQVVVRHEELEKEEIYPLIKGEAFPRIYTSGGVILFQDEKQRRYEATVEYSLIPLMDDPELLQRVVALGCREPGILLAYLSTHDICRANLDVFRSAADTKAFTLHWRRKLLGRLLDYFTENETGEDLEKHLLALDASKLEPADRSRLITALTVRRLDREALSIISALGSERVENDVLMKLASRCILNQEEEREEELLYLACQVFRSGLYDEVILSYLMQYMCGPVEDLFALYRAAQGFDLDTYGIEEKILKTLLFTGDHRKDMEDVLAAYIRHGGREDVVTACLTHIAYGTFVLEYTMSPFVLSLLYRYWDKGRELPGVCRLALLKELSRGKARGVPVSSAEDRLLEECVAAGWGFAFFRRLPQSKLARFGLDDKIYVEIHEDPASSVTLYYRMESGLAQDQNVCSENLPMIYPGIFNRCFTLFYGESIHYWFEVTKDDKQVRTSERVLTMTRVESSSISRYQRINQMLSARKSGKQQEMKDKMKAYLRQEQYAGELFHLDAGE